MEILSEADREYVKTKAAAGSSGRGLGEVDAELEDAPLPKALGRKLVPMERKSVRRHEADADEILPDLPRGLVQRAVF